MTHITGQFPNDTYFNGLRDNPESSIAVVYDEFRLPILQAFAAMGESEEDAAFFFQMAVNDAARIVRSGATPPTVSFPGLLQALSMAHFRARTEASVHLPDSPTEDIKFDLPTPEILRETQDKALAWACLQDLSPDCQDRLLAQAALPPTDAPLPEQYQACAGQLLQALQAEGASATEMPASTLAALRDTDGYAIWRRTQALEQNWGAEKPPPPPESNQIWRWAIAVFLLVLVGYGAFQFFVRPKTAAEVFADNFAPPGSLMADMEARYGTEMGNDSVSARPSACMLILREADVYYQASNYQAAMDALLLLVLDSASICQSDAWFFLGIIQLQLEDPATAIQCFSKIEDLERYGEDIYWYQALAFVQMAKGNPLLRDRAKHAIERTHSNTRDPKRRAQAEAMLKNLSK
ncbi:MAG: hypothetical protein IPM98_08705 [Lewinellaceae bacterium]|nr:hypothetical protein [Lewinellaceae bacterium]